MDKIGNLHILNGKLFIEDMRNLQFSKYHPFIIFLNNICFHKLTYLLVHISVDCFFEFMMYASEWAQW